MLLYKGMRFRQYVSENDIPANRTGLIETDLLGSPSSGTSTNAGESPLSKSQWTNSSSDAQAAGDNQPPAHGEPLGSGRPPDAMDGQLKKAAGLATELLKILTTMPSPWNRRFGVSIRALRGLLDKLSQVS
jgi:hypothetical protein